METTDLVTTTPGPKKYRVKSTGSMGNKEAGYLMLQLQEFYIGGGTHEI